MGSILPDSTFQAHHISKQLIGPGKTNTFSGSCNKDTVCLIIRLHIFSLMIDCPACDLLINLLCLLIITGSIVESGQKHADFLIYGLILFGKL